MNGGAYTKLGEQSLFYVVYLIVDKIDILLSVHLGVQGRNNVSGTVAVNHHIVNSKYLRLLFGYKQNTFNHLRRGRRAENRIFRIVKYLHSRDNYHCGHGKSHIGIRSQARKTANHGGNQHCRGCHRVRKTVRSCCGYYR